MISSLALSHGICTTEDFAQACHGIRSFASWAFCKAWAANFPWDQWQILCRLVVDLVGGLDLMMIDDDLCYLVNIEFMNSSDVMEQRVNWNYIGTRSHWVPHSGGCQCFHGNSGQCEGLPLTISTISWCYCLFLWNIICCIFCPAYHLPSDCPRR